MSGKKFMALVAGASAALALGIAASVLTGPAPDEVPRGEEVQGRVMSPFCEGLTLAECPSSQAAELRSAIEEKISQGWTNRRLDAWLSQNYGEKVLAGPRGIQAWLPPVVWASGGGMLVGLAAARWGRRNPVQDEVAATEEASPEDSHRLIRELEQFRENTE